MKEDDIFKFPMYVRNMSNKELDNAIVEHKKELAKIKTKRILALEKPYIKFGLINMYSMRIIPRDSFWRETRTFRNLINYPLVGISR